MPRNRYTKTIHKEQARLREAREKELSTLEKELHREWAIQSAPAAAVVGIEDAKNRRRMRLEQKQLDKPARIITQSA
jgi:hypothetical protein